jgi:2-haloacid dehalogenase
VTFDCFGTLVDWEAGLASALRPIAGERAGDLLRAYHAQEQLVEREQPHRAYKDVLVTALGRAAAETGVTVPPSATHALPQAWSSLRLFDDVEAMLAELRLRGYRLAVLTNCDEDLFDRTHRLFRVPFDLVLTAERVRGYKPAPWHFRGFERLARVARADWVHVANSVYHDLAPARALGVQHLWLDRAHSGPAQASADRWLRVTSALEVAAAVDRLLGRATRAARPEAAPQTCCV